MAKRLLALFALVLALAACGAQTPKEFAWQQIDTTVDVRVDGTLHITEAMTIRYLAGTFSFIERDLPYRGLDRIEEVTVEADQRSFEQASGGQPYTFSVEELDGFKRIRMNYPKTTSGTRTVYLRYTVGGAIQRNYFTEALATSSSNTQRDEDEQRQQVWWSMVFPQRDRPVEHATGRINLPKQLDTSAFSADAPDVAGTVEQLPGAATVAATNVPPGQELTLRVLFPRLIEDDEAMGYFSPYTTNGAANRALPEEEGEPSPWTDPRLFFGVIIVVVSVVYHIRRWIRGEYEESDYERGYQDGYGRARRRWYSSSSSHSSSRSSSGGGRRGGGASGGGGGRVG